MPSRTRGRVTSSAPWEQEEDRKLSDGRRFQMLSGFQEGRPHFPAGRQNMGEYIFPGQRTGRDELSWSPILCGSSCQVSDLRLVRSYF